MTINSKIKVTFWMKGEDLTSTDYYIIFRETTTNNNQGIVYDRI